jgi:hypothetical protein
VREEERLWSDVQRSPTKLGSKSRRSFPKTASVAANGKTIARS